MLELRRLPEAGDRPVLPQVDDTERRAHLRDHHRRRGARRVVLGDEPAVVEIEQLVAVQREHRPALPTARRGELQPAAAAERLRLADRLDLRAEAAERVDEDLFLAGLAGDDHARDAGADEARDRVLRQGAPGHGDERLGVALGGLPEPFRLAACEQQGLHR